MDADAGAPDRRKARQRGRPQADAALREGEEDLPELMQTQLGYRFRDPRLLSQALTHSSVATDERPSNERLEFLGDAVVGIVISDYLYRSAPGLSEGEMTVIKSAVVSRRTMARVGRALGLPAFLQVDEGLRKRKAYPQSIVANVYEAIVGAMFLDGGMRAASDFVLRTLELHVQRVGGSRHAASSKSTLQELAQADGKGAPRYGILRYEGPEHDRRFLAVVYVAGQEQGSGWGATKKEAEQNAAREALQKLYPEKPE